MTKTAQQHIFELEQKIRLLERQNKFLEQQILDACALLMRDAHTEPDVPPKRDED